MINIVILISIVALFMAIVKMYKIRRIKINSEHVSELTELIYNGALTYLKKQYSIIIVFTVLVFVLLSIFLDYRTAISFILGALFSGIAGNIGMRVATIANGRTAEACEKSLNGGLKIAFSSGSVMGLTVTGLGLLGVSILFLLFKNPTLIYGFGFGASSIALFARVGGGIYTKAADVGADLVGKVEAGIPEDDPRNPAVIADNVGDNVGDVAGMGADLFESYVDAIIVSMAIGVLISMNAVYLPLLVASVGIISSIVGMLFVRVGENENAGRAMNKGLIISTLTMLILSYIVILNLVSINVWITVVLGLFAGTFIGLITEYYTSYNYKPTKSIAESAKTGAATDIITGISVGMISTTIPIILISFVMITSFHFAGLYGIAMAAVGMLSTLAITLASDTYGPVADNAAGIAEMAKLGKKARERAESLDAVGNTTAAIGKGFAIGSAALTALALFSAYSNITNINIVNLLNPSVVAGLFIGTLLPFLFSSFALRAVGNAAFEMVNEVRKQFKNIKGLLRGKAKPNYERCIAISTHAAIKQMILPSLIAIFSPLVIAMLLGKHALAGMLAGSIASGFLLALFMANSGGAWDNAKKYIEAGNFGGKGSFAHKASVVGDTVGDPFKDTAGPSLNILIKLMSIIAIIIAPLL